MNTGSWSVAAVFITTKARVIQCIDKPAGDRPRTLPIKLGLLPLPPSPRSGPCVRPSPAIRHEVGPVRIHVVVNTLHPIVIARARRSCSPVVGLNATPTTIYTHPLLPQKTRTSRDGSPAVVHSDRGGPQSTSSSLSVTSSIRTQPPPKIHAELRAGFKSGRTKSITYRKEQLAQLAYLLKDNEQRFRDALKADLGRPEMESDMCVLVFSRLSCCSHARNALASLTPGWTSGPHWER